MPRIIPIKELKNTAEISNLCQEANEPIFITKNGYGDMVIMNIETYEKIVQRDTLYRELEISEQQMENGDMYDAYEVLDAIKKKHGL